MKRSGIDSNRLERLFDVAFAHLRNVPQREVDSACERVFRALHQKPDVLPDAASVEAVRPRRNWSRPLMALTAAIMVMLVSLLMPAIRDFAGIGALAVVENSGGRLYATSGKALHPGARIRASQAIRTDNGANALVRLTDGSRIEMRSNSEMSVERADHGIRIRLNKGGVIVNAAKQLDGRHLYVDTRDVTVSVVGTVFLVNVEEEGSRIAVIEGEVRVHQGSTEKSLFGGEQVATNPSMELQPVQKEISWSPATQAQMAQLQQSATRESSTVSQGPNRMAFEEIAIRAVRSEAGAGGRGGDGVSVTKSGCAITSAKVDPARFAVSGVTVYTLIVWAFTAGDLSGFGCLNGDALKLVSGGPDWTRTARWDLQATIPDGARRYTEDELKRGDMPELKMRLRTLLADRFKLVIRPEMRDMPVFLLTYGRDPSTVASSNDAVPWLTGKEWPEVTLSRRPILVQMQPRNEEAVSAIWGRSASMAELATELAQRMEVGRPVLDRTNLKGVFNFDMWYAPTIEGCWYCGRGAAAGIRFASSPTIFAALEQQAGLKLEAGRAVVEVQVIEHVEMPSEN